MVVQGYPLPSVKVITLPVSTIVTVIEANGLVREGTEVDASDVNDPMLSVQMVVRMGKQDEDWTGKTLMDELALVDVGALVMMRVLRGRDV